MNAALIFWPVLAQITLLLAWLYVGLRVAHAFIHIGSNYVPRRMQVFVLSVGALLALLVVCAWQLARA